MKPAPFGYHDPRTIEEALDLLARLENARLLAGGQSLVPMLNFRIARPSDLIDLNRVAGLDRLTESATGLSIGAMVRQRELEISAAVRRRCPLLVEALGSVGHRTTRNRGTMGGSLAHLDPSAELPVAALALDATLHLRSARGARVLPMALFPAGVMTPALEAGEMLTRIDLADWPHGHGFAFIEFGRRRDAFAIVTCAVLITIDAGNRIERASLALGGIGPVPVRLHEAERAVTGTRGAEADLERATACTAALDAFDDYQASAEHRRHLAGVMIRRGVARALARARGEAPPPSAR